MATDESEGQVLDADAGDDADAAAAYDEEQNNDDYDDVGCWLCGLQIREVS